jgi:cell division protein FtsI (penicillin-binding protein 3)
MRKRRQRLPVKKLWDEEFEKIRLQKSKKRTVIIRTIIFFCFFVVFVRLFVLMVLDHEMLSKKAEQQYQTTKTIKAQRGRIWDRRMRPLAVNIETDSVYGVPSKAEDIEGLSRQLASVINLSAERIKTRFLTKKDKSFVWLARKVDEETSFRIKTLRSALDLEEIGILTEAKRYYPNGHIAAHIIGYTDIDNQGLAGIELIYNDYMKGRAGKVSVGMDARGQNLYEGLESYVAGNELFLTIDETLQNIVERELENAAQRWKAESAVAIMMDPNTGEVLAMANRPTYDPNFPGSVDPSYRRNRAITDIYEPGSTFKVILASAAIEEGVVRPGEKFDVSQGFIRVPGGIIKDPHKHEILTFSEIIQKSSNVGAVQIGLRLGKERLYKYIKKFGFGEKTGIDLPGEVRGLVRSIDKWSGRSLASISIGHEIAVTPLQILRAYSAIANGGKLVKPYIVSEIVSSNGEVIKRFPPMIKRRVISESTARIMREVLKTVVEEGGTGESASIHGNLVAGKTGTAQMIDPETGTYSKEDFVSSFIGFVPADNPKIALIVVIYKPKGERYGGVVAAPVFKNIIEHSLIYLNIPMEKQENYVVLVSRSD